LSPEASYPPIRGVRELAQGKSSGALVAMLMSFCLPVFAWFGVTAGFLFWCWL